MKNFLSLLAVSFLAFTSSSLFAQNYYVCDSGDDSNNGKSESAPFRSFEKAIETFNTLSAGDSVLLCRGGVFPLTARTRVANTNCNASSVCTLADYGDPQKDRPHVIFNGDYGMRFSQSETKPGSGFVVKNIILNSTTGVSAGIFLYGHVADVTLENLHIEGFKLGIQIANTIDVDRVALKNSVIIKNVGQGWLGGCDDCLIENNHFENNGRNGKHHNIYLSTHNVAASNMIVRGNTLYKSAMQDGKCVGVSLVAHGHFDNLIIENNLVKEDVGAVDGHCWGISVDAGYAEEEVFRNVVIRGNKLLNVGNVGIGCASCDGAIIEKNIIIDEGSVLVHGISVPVLREDTVKSKNIKITDNTIVLSKTWNKIAGIVAGGVNPVTVQNNTISLPDNPLGVCVLTKDASANIDISSNTCKNHTSVSVIYKTIDESTTVLASTEPTSTASTSTEPTSTASTSTEPTSTEPTSTASTSTEPTSTASTSTEPTSTDSTTLNEPQSSIKVVSLGNYKSSRGKPGGGVGFKIKCRAEASDGRCLLQ